MSKSVDGRAGEPAPLTRRQAIELVHDPLNELAMRFQQACAKWSAATPDGSMANILLAASALLASPPSAGPASAGVRAAAPPAELVALLRSGGSANYALAPVLRARDDHVSAEQCTADARRMYDLANEMESPAVSPLLPSVTGEPMLAYLRSMLTCPDEQYPLYAHILLENVERIIAFIEAPAVPLAQQGAGSTGGAPTSILKLQRYYEHEDGCQPAPDGEWVKFEDVVDALGAASRVPSESPAPLAQPTPDAWALFDNDGCLALTSPNKRDMEVARDSYGYRIILPLYLRGGAPASGETK